MITAPFTRRFCVDSPAELASPLMPLLRAKNPLRYSVRFVRPQVTESDYAWYNFQDQIVVQTRLSTLVVVLHALCECRLDSLVVKTVVAFSPHALPTVKAPSLKLFEYIERGNRDVRDTGVAVRRALPTVPESFNGSKKNAEHALAPLVSLPTTVTSRPSSSERPLSSSRPASRPSSGSALLSATAVSSQAEATAVILRLRARHSTRAGTASLQLPPASDDALKDAAPESRLDATTKAELGAFNRLVAAAKDTVAQGRESAKSELDYYRQFLPRASSASAGGPSAVTSQAPLITPVRGGAVKTVKATRPPARLPTLTTSVASAETLAEVESNQETSPVHVSVAATLTATGSAPASLSRLSSKTKTKTMATSRAPSADATRRAKAATKERGRSVQPSGTIRTASRPEQQPQVKDAKKPVPRSRKHQLAQQRVHDRASTEASLSDFDDPDPEVDDAPTFLDDLGGMRVLTDNDDDEY